MTFKARRYEKIVGIQWAIPEISTPPLWTTLNWVPKIPGFPRRTVAVYAGFQTLLDSKSWGIPEFCKILNGFAGIPIKIHKMLGKYMEFQSGSLSIYYRISNVVHGGCVDIFWNSPVEIVDDI